VRYRPNLARIELDLLWDCNLRCKNCDRSCRQAPSAARMTPAQVARFIDQSVRAGRHWERIALLGGEPTLHPELDEILDLLLGYRAQRAPETEIRLVTNGHGEIVQRVLAGLPAEVVVRNTRKQGVDQDRFEPFNLAPRDLPACRGASFDEGCWVTADCGLGLNRHGYYPCGVAGGIARVAGLRIALAELPTDPEQLRPALAAVCQLCGHFLRGEFEPRSVRRALAGEPCSLTWRRLYRKYAVAPATLPRWGE